jgi:RNAse (barnase) inhibitor barstar
MWRMLKEEEYLYVKYKAQDGKPLKSFVAISKKYCTNLDTLWNAAIPAHTTTIASS